MVNVYLENDITFFTSVFHFLTYSPVSRIDVISLCLSVFLKLSTWYALNPTPRQLNSKKSSSILLAWGTFLLIFNKKFENISNSLMFLYITFFRNLKDYVCISYSQVILITFFFKIYFMFFLYALSLYQIVTATPHSPRSYLSNFEHFSFFQLSRLFQTPTYYIFQKKYPQFFRLCFGWKSLVKYRKSEKHQLQVY